MRRLACTALIACALIIPDAADAREPDQKPWGQGILMPSLGLGGSFGGDISQLYVGAGVSYFVINGLAPGLDLNARFTFYSERYKNSSPGLVDNIPTHEFRIVPSLQYVFYRNRWFSPYAYAGVGPLFLNHGGGTLGYWIAGPGFYIGIGGPVFLNLGVTFSSPFPKDQCLDAYSYELDNVLYMAGGACNVGWGIRAGLVLSFGVGGKKKQRERPPPASEPYYRPAPVPSTSPGYAEPQPPASQPPPGQPPTSQPPPGAPPTSQPPPGQPPTNQPPPGAPPTSQPPPGQPPTSQPPPGAPPTSQPPPGSPPT
ncbi:MAG: hypothetical protein R3A51_09935 [Nannocystaceae bacterium]